MYIIPMWWVRRRRKTTSMKYLVHIVSKITGKLQSVMFVDGGMSSEEITAEYLKLMLTLIIHVSYVPIHLHNYSNAVRYI